MGFFPEKTARERQAMNKPGTGMATSSCSKVIPIYPLRYGVVPKNEKGNDYDLPSIEKGAFPALEGSRYVLRPLRHNRGYVYIYDQKHPEKVIVFVYCTRMGISMFQADPNPLFWRLQIDDQGKHSFIRSGLSEEQGPSSDDLGNPFLYIPAFTHEPETVSFLFSDFPLGKKQLDDFKKSGGSDIRQKNAVEIPLKKWIDAARSGGADPTDVKHTLGISTISAQAFGIREGTEKASFWETCAVSEYGTKVELPTQQSLDIARGHNTGKPFPMLGVVLPDPIGLMSELNASAGRINAKYIAYNNESSRKERASDGVEVFLNAARAEVLAKRGDRVPEFDRQPLRKHLARIRYGKNSYDLLTDKEKVAIEAEVSTAEQRYWEKVYRPVFKRLAYVKEEERQKFLAEHKKKLQELSAELKPYSKDVLAYDKAAAPWSWRTASETLYDRLNNDGYIAFRATLSRCFQGFVLEPEGAQMLVDMLPVEGEPTGLFALLVDPETEVGKYVADVKKMMQQEGAPAGPVEHQKGLPPGGVLKGAGAGMKFLAQKRLDLLLKLFAKVPADNASMALTDVITYANAKYASNANSLRVLFNEKSTVHILLETAAKQIAYKQSVEASKIADTIIAMAKEESGYLNLSKIQAYGARFKSANIPNGQVGDLVMVVTIKDTPPLKPPHPALEFWIAPEVWSKIKVGALGLALLGSLYNAAVAFEALGEKDGQALVKCLNFGREIALAASTPYLMKEIWMGEIAKDTGASVLASRFAMRFVGAAALCMGIKDFIDARNQHGIVQNLSVADMVAQVAIFGVAAYYLSATAASASVSSAIFGPGGLIVGGLIILSVVLKIWQEQEKKEQRITDWLNRCIWGRALPSESYVFLTEETKPYTYEEEIKELFKILYTPIITRRRLGGEAAFMHLEVLLPDWRPQISDYELIIKMRRFSSQLKEIPLLNTPELVHDEGNGFGKLAISAQTLGVPAGYLNNEGIDYAILKYWPNRVTAPDDFVETPQLMN